MVVDFSFAQNTVGFIIENDMDRKSMIELRKRIKEKIEKFEVINLYIEDCGMERITLNATLLGAIFPIENAGSFGKIAIVTNRKWIHMIASFENLLIKAEMKNFTSKNRMDAMSWITE